MLQRLGGSPSHTLGEFNRGETSTQPDHIGQHMCSGLPVAASPHRRVHLLAGFEESRARPAMLENAHRALATLRISLSPLFLNILSVRQRDGTTNSPYCPELPEEGGSAPAKEPGVNLVPRSLNGPIPCNARLVWYAHVKEPLSPSPLDPSLGIMRSAI